jgi:hypothetical protein
MDPALLLLLLMGGVTASLIAYLAGYRNGSQESTKFAENEAVRQWVERVGCYTCQEEYAYRARERKE